MRLYFITFFFSYFFLCRFLTPEELDGLIAYLKDKRARLVRPSEDPLAGNHLIKGLVHINASFDGILMFKDKFSKFLNIFRILLFFVDETIIISRS